MRQLADGALVQVWCNGEKKAIVRDKIFSRRRSNVRVAHAVLALSAAKKFGRSLSRSGGRPSEVSQPLPRSRLTGIAFLLSTCTENAHKISAQDLCTG